MVSLDKIYQELSHGYVRHSTWQKNKVMSFINFKPIDVRIDNYIQKNDYVSIKDLNGIFWTITDKFGVPIYPYY